MRKISFILCLIFIFICGCKQETPTIKIGVLPDVDSIPIAVAQANGYLENCEIVPFKSAVDRSAAFRTGSIDLAVSDLITTICEYETLNGIKILTGTCGRYCLVSSSQNKDNQVTLNSVAVSSGTVIEFIGERFQKKLGINWQQPSIPIIPTRLEAVLNGQVDGAILPEPYATIAVNKGCNRLLSYESCDIGVIVANKNAVTKKNDLIEQFLNSYDKAVQDLQYGTADILKAIEILGLPAETDITALPTYKKSALPDSDSVDFVSSYLFDRGDIKTEVDLSDLGYY